MQVNGDVYCTEIQGRPGISNLRRVPVGSIITPLDPLMVEIRTSRVHGDVAEVDWQGADLLLNEWAEWASTQ